MQLEGEDDFSSSFHSSWPDTDGFNGYGNIKRVMAQTGPTRNPVHYPLSSILFLSSFVISITVIIIMAKY